MRKNINDTILSDMLVLSDIWGDLSDRAQDIIAEAFAGKKDKEELKLALSDCDKDYDDCGDCESCCSRCDGCNYDEDVDGDNYEVGDYLSADLKNGKHFEGVIVELEDDKAYISCSDGEIRAIER